MVLIHLRSLLVLSLVVTTARSAFLAPVSRAFHPGYSFGTWILDTSESSRTCPASIRHTSYRATADKNVFKIRHNDIFHDINECDGRDEMAMIASRVLLNTSLFDGASPVVQTQVERYLLADDDYMLTAERLSAAGHSFFGIVELGARLCGTSARFEEGTKGFFVADSKSGAFTLAPFKKKLAAARRHMALFEGGVGGRRCLYHALIKTARKKRPLNELPAIEATPAPPPIDEAETTTAPKATPTPATAAPPPPPPSVPDADGPASVFGDGANETAATTGTRACFPASALVDLRSGASARMAELAVGDEVHVGQGRYSTVFMFTHRDEAAAHRFVRIVAASGHELEASAGHFVYLGGRLRPAMDARVGHTLVLADGSDTVVSAVELVQRQGLYNPQTLHGDIVVGGVLASTYTTAVHPAAAHPLLAPFRAFCRAFSAAASASA